MIRGIWLLTVSIAITASLTTAQTTGRISLITVPLKHNVGKVLGISLGKPIEFHMGGSSFEDAQWTDFLERVGTFCKAGG
jgi:hypothetical protein